MYVNATYSILCNNYGNDPIPISQVSLVFHSLSAGLSQPPQAEPSPRVAARAASVARQPLHPTSLSPAELPALLPRAPFLRQTTHTLPSSRDGP
ncbi:unnamed protein product [Gulo gulo]|uniref:Uncharacterized protein n=1 Tax=Gulo gulo TaxID=48420 RepID=A0A9X9M7I4_GULGU|nr:unnamed protein product [Gulo gulo]